MDQSAIAAEVRRLERTRAEAVAASRVNRDAAFLHTDETPVLEDVNGFKCWPLTMPRYNLLRLMQSPFLTGATPTQIELADFLWVVHPKYAPGGSLDQQAHYWACKKFIPPRRPFFKLWRKKWIARCAHALVEETRTVVAARNYLAEAMAENPALGGGASGGTEFYSDFCCNVFVIARETGWGEPEILRMPLKRIFQYLKIIREIRAHEAGVEPLLWNPGDEITDRQLKILNQKN